MLWQVFLTDVAEQRLLAIKDRRIRKLLHARAMKLQESPKQQGKSLGRNLAGYRSVRAVGQRYRIVYELDDSRHEVWVATLGIRKEGDKADVYRIAASLKEK